MLTVHKSLEPSSRLSQHYTELFFYIYTMVSTSLIVPLHQALTTVDKPSKSLFNLMVSSHELAGNLISSITLVYQS